MQRRHPLRRHRRALARRPRSPSTPPGPHPPARRGLRSRAGCSRCASAPPRRRKAGYPVIESEARSAAAARHTAHSRQDPSPCTPCTAAPPPPLMLSSPVRRAWRRRWRPPIRRRGDLGGMPSAIRAPGDYSGHLRAGVDRTARAAAVHRGQLAAAHLGGLGPGVPGSAAARGESSPEPATWRGRPHLASSEPGGTRASGRRKQAKRQRYAARLRTTRLDPGAWPGRDRDAGGSAEPVRRDLSQVSAS